MESSFSSAPPSERLARLRSYLDSDPGNVTLLSDTAETALAERRPDIAHDVLSRYAAERPLPAKELGMAGLAAMQLGDFAAAAERFALLLETNPADTAVRFNLAWSRAMLKDFPGALALLDAQTTDALGQAAMLHVQLLHEKGEFDEAAEQARRHLARHPDHGGLNAVISVLALDNEDIELAAACASRAGDHPDALTTLGTLALGDDRDAEALDLFERALARNADSARAWLGKGLVELSSGAHTDAVRDIRRGAELFGDHVGSWLAAGWSNVVTDNIAAGKADFEKALALDHNFSESHGSLAVVAIIEGNTEEARRLAQTAIRLDRQSFSGALAHALLLNSDGKPEVARAIINRALNTPIGASGKTIAQSLVKHELFA